VEGMYVVVVGVVRGDVLLVEVGFGIAL